MFEERRKGSTFFFVPFTDDQKRGTTHGDMERVCTHCFILLFFFFFAAPGVRFMETCCILVRHFALSGSVAFHRSLCQLCRLLGDDTEYIRAIHIRVWSWLVILLLLRKGVFVKGSSYLFACCGVP